MRLILSLTHVRQRRLHPGNHLALQKWAVSDLAKDVSGDKNVCHSSPTPGPQSIPCTIFQSLPSSEIDRGKGCTSPCIYQNHWTVHFKWARCVACELWIKLLARGGGEEDVSSRGKRYHVHLSPGAFQEAWTADTKMFAMSKYNWVQNDPTQFISSIVLTVLPQTFHCVFCSHH